MIWTCLRPIRVAWVEVNSVVVGNSYPVVTVTDRIPYSNSKSKHSKNSDTKNYGQTFWIDHMGIYQAFLYFTFFPVPDHQHKHKIISKMTKWIFENFTKLHISRFILFICLVWNSLTDRLLDFRYLTTDFCQVQW